MLGFTSINDVFPTIGLSIIVLTNNGDTPPDNIAKDILAKLDPGFEAKRDTAAAGETLQITAKAPAATSNCTRRGHFKMYQPERCKVRRCLV